MDNVRVFQESLLCQRVPSSAPEEYSPFPDAVSCSPKILFLSGVRVPRSGSSHQKRRSYHFYRNNPKARSDPRRNRIKKHPFRCTWRVLPILPPVRPPWQLCGMLLPFSYLSGAALLLSVPLSGSYQFRHFSVLRSEQAHMQDKRSVLP